jgi:hypothetical protein
MVFTPIARNVNSGLHEWSAAASVSGMTNTSIRWGVATVAMILAQLTLIALSVACVAVYSYAIHTGETREFYTDFANASGPWVSLITGGPVFFLLGRWIRRRAPHSAFNTALAMCGLYLAIEVTTLILWQGDASTKLGAVPFMISGFIVKAIGTWMGTGGRGMRARAQTA